MLLAEPTQCGRDITSVIATVFAVTPRRAWCNWPTGKRIAVHRAGVTSTGRSSHLAIWRSEQTQWRLMLADKSAASSIAVIATENVGSRGGTGWVIGINSFALLTEGLSSRCILKQIGK